MAPVNRFEAAWAELVARIWSERDEGARAKLIENARSVFAEQGAELPPGVEIVVIENSPNKLHFVLPPPPEELDRISDESLSELYRACPGTVCATGGGGN